MKHFKRQKDYGFFVQDIRLSKLSQIGDPLEKLNAGVDFEKFRTLLENNFCKLPENCNCNQLKKDSCVFLLKCQINKYLII
jgi:hypothetical protein